MSAQPEFVDRSCGHRIQKGRKNCPYCRTPRLSVAPLAEAVSRRANQLGTLTKVSVEVATRLGMRYESVDRQLRKILQGKMSKLDFYLADAYAVALGEEMPALLWGEEWDDANPVEPYGDEEML